MHNLGARNLLVDEAKAIGKFVKTVVRNGIY
jgi:hypothetical protein